MVFLALALLAAGAAVLGAADAGLPWKANPAAAASASAMPSATYFRPCLILLTSLLIVAREQGDTNAREATSLGSRILGHWRGRGPCDAGGDSAPRDARGRCLGARPLPCAVSSCRRRESPRAGLRRATARCGARRASSSASAASWP